MTTASRSHPVAYSVGGYYGPLLPGGRNREEQLPRILRKLGDHGEAVAAAYAELPEIPHDDEYDWQARQVEDAPATRARTSGTGARRAGSPRARDPCGSRSC
jgi:hypothetical protein